VGVKKVEMTADAREDEDTVLPATSVSLNHTGKQGPAKFYPI
jgi:hypothetical protein